MRVSAAASTPAPAGPGAGVKVRVTMATSSMPRPTTIGSGMPTGMRSRLAMIRSRTRRIAVSCDSPT